MRAWRRTHLQVPRARQRLRRARSAPDGRGHRRRDVSVDVRPAPGHRRGRRARPCSPRTRGVARMVVHNADGSIAEMCGNGLRCAVKYLVDHAGEPPRAPRRGDGRGRALAASRATARTASPKWISPWAPRGWWRRTCPRAPRASRSWTQPLPGHPGLRGSAVSMGNPHLVLLDRPLEEAERLGPTLERHPALHGPHQRRVRPGGRGRPHGRGVGARLRADPGLRHGRVRRRPRRRCWPSGSRRMPGCASPCRAGTCTSGYPPTCPTSASEDLSRSSSRAL